MAPTAPGPAPRWLARCRHCRRRSAASARQGLYTKQRQLINRRSTRTNSAVQVLSLRCWCSVEVILSRRPGRRRRRRRLARRVSGGLGNPACCSRIDDGLITPLKFQQSFLAGVCSRLRLRGRARRPQRRSRAGPRQAGSTAGATPGHAPARPPGPRAPPGWRVCSWRGAPRRGGSGPCRPRPIVSRCATTRPAA